jgi:hypothetical protein
MKPTTKKTTNQNTLLTKTTIFPSTSMIKTFMPPAHYGVGIVGRARMERDDGRGLAVRSV